VPALHGENVVLRILDHEAGRRTLVELGMPGDVRERFEAVLGRPSGMVLVTGPTGSGKTTTLYGAIDHLNDPGLKLVSIEDPVEYVTDGVTQIPVNPKAGFGFASALRSILRHDPDVVMVGEMRDRETAELAVQASLTGHRVLSTLHTNDAVSAVTRLVDMGIEPYLVAATVHGILAQRLVRVPCAACAEAYAPDPSTVGELVVRVGDGESGWRRAAGCEACAFTGYRGRTGIYELLVVGERFRAMLVERRPVAELRAEARTTGMTTLRENGMAAASAGRTTVEEVLRVTGDAEPAQ
jgi:type II secretory ATPase GspE/PulE/Tfp pilus assembly ATPase PilB-like protein